MYYYCATRKPTQIKKIKIERLTKKSSTEVVLNKKDITQVVNSQAEIGALQNIDLNALKVGFFGKPQSPWFSFWFDLSNKISSCRQ